jgi:hypothetical protein
LSAPVSVWSKQPQCVSTPCLKKTITYAHKTRVKWNVLPKINHKNSVVLCDISSNLLKPVSNEERLSPLSLIHKEIRKMLRYEN